MLALALALLLASPAPRRPGPARAQAAVAPEDAPLPQTAPAPPRQPLDPLPAQPPEPPAAGPVLPLAEAFRVAREANPDLAVARERIVSSEIALSRAWDALKPTLTATGTYTRNSTGVAFPGIGANGQPVTITSQAVNALNGALVAQWNLLNFRVLPALGTAEQQVEVQRLTESQVRRELLLQVASVALTGAGLRELAQVAARQSRTNRAHAEQAQARYEAGTIQRSAVVRARLDALRQDEEQTRTYAQYDQAKSQLAQLLDRHDIAFELEAPKDAPPEVKGTFAALLQDARVARPELAIGRASEEIAARLKTDAWAQFLPTLGLNATGRYTNAPGYGDNITWAVALALTIPLYDGGLRYAALRDADSQLRLARAQTKSQEGKVEDELRRAALDLDAAKAVRTQADHALTLARENEALVRAQFEAGVADQVTVSDAEAALFQSEAAVVRERLNVQLSALRLARAAGAFDPH